MDTRITRANTISKAIAVAALALLLACVAASCVSTPQEAIADTGKHALPTIRKSVSVDGGQFGEAVSGTPGCSLTYRIVLTMPEGVAECGRLSYTVVDEPDAAISPKLASVTARLVDADGAVKATLHPSRQVDGSTVRINFGDLKDSCADLAFGDRVVVEYPAQAATSIAPGEKRNIARLLYDTGSGLERSAQVMARVTISATRTQRDAKVRSDSLHTNLPRTGDGRTALALPAIFIAICALGASEFARNRRNS